MGQAVVAGEAMEPVGTPLPVTLATVLVIFAVLPCANVAGLTLSVVVVGFIATSGRS
jgi:hypothetical protein